MARPPRPKTPPPRCLPLSAPMSPRFRRRCLAALLVLFAGALALIPLRARAQADAPVILR